MLFSHCKHPVNMVFILQELLLRLQQDSSLPYHFAEGTLYLDPDIIDLTMIPPPITPDHVSD